MRKIRLLLTTLRYTRLRQLLHRLRLVARRHVNQHLRRGRRMPRWWSAPIPERGSPLSAVLTNGLTLGQGDGRLPYEVSLAGTPFVIDQHTGWDAPNLNRGTRLEKLHLHYMQYLDGLAPADAEIVVLDWIRSNPPYRRDYWKDSWNSYALSIRSSTWLRLLARGDLPASGNPGLEIETSVVRQLRFLKRNLELDIGGNHLIRNIRALLWGGAYFTGSEAKDWRRLATRYLEREIGEQILPDGMHFELSPSYHLQVFADLLECFQLLPDGPLRTALGQRLDAMAQVAVDFTHPDGLPSLFNDGGLHMTIPPGTALGIYEQLRGLRPEPRSTWRLENAGYVGTQLPSSLLIMDCGRIGPDHLPAHAHGDVLSFEWSVAGQRIIVDAGVSEYHPGPLRALSRSTRAHNTVTLDDQDQAEFWASFRVGRRPNVTLEEWAPVADGFRCVARHDGFNRLRGQPHHRRALCIRDGCLIVEDSVLGGDGQEVVGRLLLHPDVRTQPLRDGMSLGIGNIEMTLHATAGVAWRETVWMPDFGTTIRTVQLIISYGCAPCTGRFEVHYK